METTPKHWTAPNHRYSSKTYSASATSHKRPLRRSSPSVSQHVASGEERAPQKFYQVEILDSYKKEGVPPPPSAICDYVIYVRPLRALTLSCLFRQCVGFNIPVEVGQEASYLLEAGPHKLRLFLVLVDSGPGCCDIALLILKYISDKHCWHKDSAHTGDEAGFPFIVSRKPTRP